MPHSCAPDRIRGDLPLPSRSLQSVSAVEVTESLAFTPDLLERRFHTVADLDEDDELEDDLGAF